MAQRIHWRALLLKVAWHDHHLHHLLLLLPEHAVEMAALLRGTERLGGAGTDTRLRALEVKRKHRNALAPADRVQKAVELEQKKLQLLGLTDATLAAREVPTTTASLVRAPAAAGPTPDVWSL